MTKFLSATFVAFAFSICSLSLASAASANDNDVFSCRDLEVQVEVAHERVDYAKNAWANRESLCEADLNRPNCYAYFKADLAAAKTELKYAQTAYKNAGCPLR